MKRSLSKNERLRKRTEIQNLFASGSSFSCKGLKLWYRSNDSDTNRVVFSPSRQFPNAVARNNVKRRGREIYRHIKYQLKPGYDLAFVFFPGEYAFLERQEQIFFLLRKTRLLIQE